MVKFKKDKGITVVIGNNKNNLLEDTYDELTFNSSNNKYTYYFDRFNTNIIDAVYYHMRNELNKILDETKKKVKNGVSEEIVVLMSTFDRMQTLKEIENIKELINKFIEDMPVPTHVIVASDTYEMCRGEEVIIAHTGDIKHFSNYEDFRNCVISF